jgi:heptosyltransferase-2
VIELWGLGDLALAVPFLRAASQHARVTLLAKPHAAPLLRRFVPTVEFVPFVAPWTAFHGKYRLHRWPWRELVAVRRELRARHFDLGISARVDPRDHLVLALAGARRRLGFPRAGSQIFLTDSIARPIRPHRAEYWRVLADAFRWNLPPGASRPPPVAAPRCIIVHTGAGKPTKVWPLERFATIVAHLRTAGYSVRLLCDADQLDWWRKQPLTPVAITTVGELLAELERATAFIGNDSGPGHVAALLGLPTFTLFGNQYPDAFAPVNPAAAWIDGSPCPYKPCFDSCRFAVPQCLHDISVEAAWNRIRPWLAS